MTKKLVRKKTNKKNCTNRIANTVGTGLVSARKSRGITLIALVITIIVMLILVAVTVTVAINGGLFGMTKKAKADTEEEQAKENTLSTGRVKIDGTWYDSMEDYVNGNKSENQNDDSTGGGSGTGHGGTYDATPKNEDGTLTANATYDTATIPAGFMVSEKKEEQEIETGLVIKDKDGNEFVWIPVKEDLVNFYGDTSLYSEPTELTDTYYDAGAEYDSQATLDHLYGKDKFNYERDFDYKTEYAEMVEQVNKYHGFYIGRYETTIDGDKIGSKYNTPVLTAETTLFSKDGTDYPYRWYGLYYASKNADVTGNGADVQTAMIYGQLWDKTMDFIRNQKEAGKTNYDVDNYTSAWHHGYVANSGTLNPGVNGDVALNIWDLESNGCEWTQETCYTGARVKRGGSYSYGSAPDRNIVDGDYSPSSTDSDGCSRLALYIKN